MQAASGKLVVPWGPTRSIHLTEIEARKYINNPEIINAVCARFKLDNQRHKLSKAHRIMLDLEVLPEVQRELIYLGEQAREAADFYSHFLYENYNLNFQMQDAIRRYIGFERVGE